MEEEKKISFFIKLKRAIFNPEAYSIFILEKPKKTIEYLLKIMIIFTIIISACLVYYMYTTDWFTNEVNKTMEIFNYSEEEIALMHDTYNDISDVVKIALIVNSVYIACVTSALLNALIFGVFAWIIARFCGMKLKYSQAFKIAVYAITLPEILQFIYNVLNLVFGITIEYFSIAYDAITYVYIITAILMLRSEIIRQRIEVGKIIKEQERVHEDLKEEEKEDKQENEEPEEEPKEEPETNKA